MCGPAGASISVLDESRARRFGQLHFCGRPRRFSPRRSSTARSGSGPRGAGRGGRGLHRSHRDRVVEGRQLGVEPICEVLRDAGVQIAPSTYYAAKTRAPSARAVRDASWSGDQGCPQGEPGCLRRAQGPRRAQPSRHRGGPVHRGAADAGRGAAWDPAGEDPPDHHQRAARRPSAPRTGRAEVRRRPRRTSCGWPT